jgi:hypothetical protein
MDKNKAIIVLSLITIIVVASTVTLYVYVQNNAHRGYLITSNIVTGYVSGVNISPNIYSPQSNIAILNEAASFNVTVFNYTNESLVVKLSVIGDDNLLYNESFNVSNQSVSSMIVREKISYSGLWLVTASTNNTRMGVATYSFQTVTNAVEANAQINYLSNAMNQQNSTNFSNTLALAAIVISIIFGVVTSIISVLSYRRKRTEPDG